MVHAARGGTPAAPRCRWAATVLLLFQVLPGSTPAAGRPGSCLRTADILSCSGLGLQQLPGEMPASSVTLDLSHNRLVLLGAGSFAGLVFLETLRLAHNRLKAVQPGTFRNSSGTLLRHLDLSSNQLRSLEQHYFLELPGLEELLLFNNRIVHVERAALGGLMNLRKVYLSHNRLVDFPFFSIQNHAHLSLLDLSSNRLSRLPLDDIAALSPWLQQGLYLHNNSLLCECPMYGLFHTWERSRFTSVTLFRSEYVCLIYGIQRATVRFFLHRRFFEHCNVTTPNRPLPEQERSMSVGVGRPLLLHCVTALTGQAISFRWVAPNGEYVVPPGNNHTLRMFANGSLEMVAAREQDSGMYWCLALDQQRRRNETWEVNVTVVLQQDADGSESFNTGFTTLLGCVVSLVLVLMYLYMTPCRCPNCSRTPPPTAAMPGQANEVATGSAQSSILTPTPPATTEGPGRKVSTNKHVVFLEPIKEQQNGGLRVESGVVMGHLEPGLLLAAEQQPHRLERTGETDSMMSVFSDTAIMFP